MLVRDVRDIGSRLCMEATIPDCEVTGVGKYGHGGGNEIDRRWLLNPCQGVNTGHKLTNNGGFFPCSIFLLRMIPPLNLVL